MAEKVEVKGLFIRFRDKNNGGEAEEIDLPKATITFDEHGNARDILVSRNETCGVSISDMIIGSFLSESIKK